MLSDLKSTRWALSISGITLAVGLASCQPQTPSAPPQAGGNSNPAEGSTEASLSGAGASFPAPLYQRWFSEYNQENSGVRISYQSVGSGAGVEQYLAKTVDFGATDAPLTDEERQEFQSKYNTEPVQLPMTGGAVVLAYNLGGNFENVRLSRVAYCGIVQGEIKQWNDPRITQANEGVNLPDRPINFVHRSDGSGTSFIFTNHLSEACPNWKAGAAKSVSWPTGIGAKGNEGVTAQIQQTEGTIGYVEYAYATENDLNAATLENKAGSFIEPSPESAARAFEGVTVPEDFALLVPDPEADQAYPINGLTWLLLYQQYDDPAKATALKNTIQWALTDGDQYAQELGYVPLPEQLQERVVSSLDIIKVAGAQ